MTTTTDQNGSARESARAYYRQPQRLRPPLEPHEKYHIEPDEYPEGCDVVWVATKVKGMETGALGEYLDNGWVPARAEDFPTHSGYGRIYPESIVRAGYKTQIGPDDTIEKDGELLMCRAKELSERSNAQRIATAKDVVSTQFERLRMSSTRAIKDRTDVVYKRGQQFASLDAIDHSL
jgi:hypothetical protein